MAFSDPGRGLIPAIEPSVTSLAKRGPDHRQVLYLEDAALGHARLAIIDLSVEAHQPFTDQTGRYHIVLNGEIFNFSELRTELESSGFSFRTRSDTEVLLNLFIARGADSLNQLNGFFAFAIYDNEEKLLFLGRDRFGIKPLLYYTDENCFIFSSTMNGITAFQSPDTIDKESLRHYFSLNYLPEPHTIYEGVMKLPAGCYAVVGNGQMKITKYWSTESTSQNTPLPAPAEAPQHLRQLMTDAVARRLVADVPVGAFLSGGLDSSIIVALAARQKPDLETFTIGFADEPHFDERPYAAAVARMYNTRHHEIVLTTADLFRDVVGDVAGESELLACYLFRIKH